MWLLLITLFFASAIPSYLLRRKLRVEYPNHANAVNQFFFIVLAIVGISVGLVLGGTIFLTLKEYVMIIGVSLIWPTYQRLSYISNSKIEVGIYQLIQNTQVIYSTLLAYFLVKEALNSNELLAVILLLGSTLSVISVLKLPKNQVKYLWLALLVPIAYAVGTTIEKIIINSSSYASYILVGFTFQCLSSLIIGKFKISDIKMLATSRHKKEVFAYGITSAFKGLFLVGANATGKIALTNAASSFTSILTVIAAYFFLREKENMTRKYIAAVIGIIGLLLVRLDPSFMRIF